MGFMGFSPDGYVKYKDLRNIQSGMSDYNHFGKPKDIWSMWLLHFHRSAMEKCPHTTCHLLHSRIYLALVSVSPTGACLQCLTLLGIAFHSYILAPHHINAPMQCFPCANFLSDDTSLNDSRFKWLEDTCQFTLGLAHLDFRSSL